MTMQAPMHVPMHVIVAHESQTIREAIRRLLAEAGYQVTAVPDGPTALTWLVARPAPEALVLDVALPGIFAHELLERLQRLGSPTKTVLVASVYNRAGYKRRPSSLYGAHDYVEQHHIPDLLLLKLANLLGVPAPDGQLVDQAVERDTHAIRDAGQARLGIRYQSAEEGRERARRLARLIVADIAIYHPDLRQLAGDERTARLREDLEEGRLLFDLRVPAEIRGATDYVGEALDEWIERGSGAWPAGGGSA